MRKRVEVNYTGRVHGVGFRFTAERLAHFHNIVGYVMNKSDGGVKVVAEGEEKNLNDFLKAVKDEMENNIDNSHADWFPASGEFKTFEIRFY